MLGSQPLKIQIMNLILHKAQLNRTKHTDLLIDSIDHAVGVLSTELTVTVKSA